MQLSRLAGNAALKEQLAVRLSDGQLSHAYILSGPADCGKHTLAAVLSSAMVCTGNGNRPCGVCSACRKTAAGIHPDIVTVLPEEEGKAITVDQIRRMRADAWVRPNEAERKVYIVEQADRMKPTAQNAMLKLLEEGPVYAAFLLLAENSGALLQTVRSRCEELALFPVSVPQAEQWLAEQFPDKPVALRRQAALDCQGLLGRAAELLSGDEGESAALNERAEQIIQLWLAGKEPELMDLCAPMEKWDKGQFAALLDRMTAQMSSRLDETKNRRKLLKLFQLMSQMRQALAVNVGQAHLAGWLCATACED